MWTWQYHWLNHQLMAQGTFTILQPERGCRAMNNCVECDFWLRWPQPKRFLCTVCDIYSTHVIICMLTISNIILCVYHVLPSHFQHCSSSYHCGLATLLLMIQKLTALAFCGLSHLVVCDALQRFNYAAGAISLQNMYSKYNYHNLS